MSPISLRVWSFHSFQVCSSSLLRTRSQSSSFRIIVFRLLSILFSWFFLCRVIYDDVTGTLAVTLCGARVWCESRGQHCYFCCVGGPHTVPHLLSVLVVLTLWISPTCVTRAQGPVSCARPRSEPRLRTVVRPLSSLLCNLPGTPRGLPSPPACSRAGLEFSLCVCDQLARGQRGP